MSDKLSLSEQQELARLQQEEAALLSQLNPPPEKSAYSDTAKRLALAAGQGVSEATGAAIGQKVGLAAAPWTLGLSVPVGGAIGGVSGYEAFQRASGQEPTWGGRFMAAGLGAIPLGPEARLIGEAGKVTGREVAERAAGQAMATTGLTAGAKAIDTGEMLSPQEAAMAAIGGGLGGAASRFAAGTAGQDAAGKPLYVAGSKKSAQALQERTRNLKEDAILDNYRSVGGVTDPMAINPGFVSEAVESVGGGQRALGERLTKINQEVNTNLVRSQFGLPSDVELSFDRFSSLRSQANQPYIEFSMLSPKAKETLNKLESARQEMKESWRSWSNDRAQKKSSNPELLKDAEAATKRVDALEESVSEIAAKSKRPELAQELKDARKRLAQMHVVESAISSPNGGPVDALVIGEINRVSPTLLTDNLKLIGDAANVARQEHIMGTIARTSTNTGGIARAASYPMREGILQFATKPGGFYQQGGSPYYPRRAPSGLGLFLRNAPSAAMGMPDQPE